MLIANNNIKLSNNSFIDNVYSIYTALNSNKCFNEKGYESKAFKIWKHEEDYYILNKSTGVIVTWWKLLGWHLCSNAQLKDADWKRFCELLKEDLENHKIQVGCPDEIEVDK